MKGIRSESIRALAGVLLLSVALAAVAPVAGAVVDAETPANVSAQGDEEFPRAEAGLDQTIQRNGSVLLDATESFSPDGEIVEYDWYITSPSGDTVVPDCDSPDCGRGRFRVPELGEYEVMVAVEDDDGRRETDTLYVTVVPRGDFGVELTGPANRTGEQANLTATIAPGDAEVQNVTWYRGNRELANQSVPTTGGVFEQSAYVVPGATYRAVATDQFGRNVSDAWSAPGGSAWTPSGPDSDQYPRIEGPALVTGSPDGKLEDEGTWLFDGTQYTVVTSEYGSVTDATWGMEAQGPTGFRAEGTQIQPELHHGVNTIVANLDIQVEKVERNRERPGNSSYSNYEVVKGLSEEEVVLRRRVVVDPKPQLVMDEDTITETGASYKFGVNDKYNPPTTARITADGETIAQTDSITMGGDINTLKETYPDSVYGQTTVRLKVVDGRRQTAADSETVHIPVPQDVRNTQPTYRWIYEATGPRPTPPNHRM